MDECGLVYITWRLWWRPFPVVVPERIVSDCSLEGWEQGVGVIPAGSEAIEETLHVELSFGRVRSEAEDAENHTLN